MTYALIATVAMLAAANIYAFKKLFDQSRQNAKNSNELTELRARLKSNEALIEQGERAISALEKSRSDVAEVMRDAAESDKESGSNIVGDVLAALLRRMQ